MVVIMDFPKAGTGGKSTVKQYCLCNLNCTWMHHPNENFSITVHCKLHFNTAVSDIKNKPLTLTEIAVTKVVACCGLCSVFTMETSDKTSLQQDPLSSHTRAFESITQSSSADGVAQFLTGQLHLLKKIVWHDLKFQGSFISRAINIF